MHEQEWTEAREGCLPNNRFSSRALAVSAVASVMSISRGFPDLSVLTAKAGRMRPVSHEKSASQPKGDPSSIAGQG